MRGWSQAKRSSDNGSIFGVLSKYGTISGHAYITVGSGESNMARGIEVYLIPNSPEFNKKNAILEKNMAGIISYSNNVLSSMSTNFNEVATGIGNLSAAFYMVKEYKEKSYIFYIGSAKESVKTNFEGEYKFEKIISGDYYIYAKYKTGFNEGHWLVAVSVKPNNITNLDLGNSNFFDEERRFGTREIIAKKELLADHLEQITRIRNGNLAAVQTRLEIEQAWDDLTTKPQKTRFDYP